MDEDGCLGGTVPWRGFGGTLAVRCDPRLRVGLDREAQRLNVPIARLVRQYCARTMPLSDSCEQSSES